MHHQLPQVLPECVVPAAAPPPDDTGLDHIRCLTRPDQTRPSHVWNCNSKEDNSCCGSPGLLLADVWLFFRRPAAGLAAPTGHMWRRQAACEVFAGHTARQGRQRGDSRVMPVTELCRVMNNWQSSQG
jgi:hypothetical protein